MNPGYTLRLPWHGRDVPHAILDVGRGCDVTCPGCYNRGNGGFKSLAQLEADFAALRRQRRLQTLSLTGGEPLLHPGLEQIVAMISRAGIKPALLTNGVRLTPELLAPLRRAGLSAVLLHIQPPQRRSDLLADARPVEWARLRAEKARQICRQGMKAGLAWIAYRHRLDELAQVIEEVLDSPDLDYLLVTAYCELRRFENVNGSVNTGLRATRADEARNHLRSEEVSMNDLRSLLEKLGLPPFGRVASNLNRQKPRWLTYRVAVTVAPDGRRFRAGIRPGLSDWLLPRLLRALTGRYAFLFVPTRWQLRTQLAANALTGGRFADDWRVILRSLVGHRLMDKHILLQEGPSLLPDGRIEFCDHCPDAVWQDNALVPVCLADRMAPAQPRTSTWKRNTLHSAPCSG